MFQEVPALLFAVYFEVKNNQFITVFQVGEIDFIECWFQFDSQHSPLRPSDLQISSA